MTTGREKNGSILMGMLFHLFQETGHLSRDCEKDGGVPCYNCGEVGHLSRDCTVSKAMLCYNCKKPGHLSKDCKETNGETSKMQVHICVINYVSLTFLHNAGLVEIILKKLDADFT